MASQAKDTAGEVLSLHCFWEIHRYLAISCSTHFLAVDSPKQPLGFPSLLMILENLPLDLAKSPLEGDASRSNNTLAQTHTSWTSWKHTCPCGEASPTLASNRPWKHLQGRLRRCSDRTAVQLDTRLSNSCCVYVSQGPPRIFAIS